MKTFNLVDVIMLALGCVILIGLVLMAIEIASGNFHNHVAI